MKKILLIFILLISIGAFTYSYIKLDNLKKEINSTKQEKNKFKTELKKEENEKENYNKKVEKIKEENKNKVEELEIWEKMEEKLKKALQ